MYGAENGRDTVMDEIKWIKLAVDIFGNSKIKQIESMPSGSSLVLMWLRLLCLCGKRNRGARLMLTDTVPYDDDMLAVEFGLAPKTVKMGLSLFEGFDMIKRVDGAIEIVSWEKYQSDDKMAEVRERNRISQQRSRERRRQLTAATNKKNDDVSRDCHVTHCDKYVDTNNDGYSDRFVTVTPIEEEEEEELDIDIHSITLTAHTGARENVFFSEEGEKNTTYEEQKKQLQRRYLGGNLGQGLVMMSAEQFEKLCEELSLEEMDKYFKIIVDCEKSGRHYRRKTHYQAILEMAMEDRKVTV